MTAVTQNSNLPQIVGDYTLQGFLGSGTYGCVGLYSYSKGKVALKVESQNQSSNNLLNEKLILNQLNNLFLNAPQDIQRFPKLIDNRQCKLTDGKQCQCLILTYYEKSLASFYMELKSVQMLISISQDLINAIKQIHSFGIIHRDIKIDNIFVHNNKVVLIDFGSATSYIDKDTKQHIRDSSYKQMKGTPCTASIHSHNNKEVSRRDDLISAIYCIMYLHKKRALLGLIFVKNLVYLVKYLQKIGFEENPDYEFIKDALESIDDQSKFIKIIQIKASGLVKKYQYKEDGQIILLTSQHQTIKILVEVQTDFVQNCVQQLNDNQEANNANDIPEIKKITDNLHYRMFDNKEQITP
ncbi:serine threonine protein kinase [Stylonychia lemnae]|uniref:Casein kinase I n=1 Tax=Stylonychia lemnae TaxID=5949 RepID=A0A078B0Q8_STYLE|nr:serine threonine protein kinase [Stylonychia lemnae]|eukprot:CDW86942.1 serine threonine protein kinase [Stylonychia lemnae]